MGPTAIQLQQNPWCAKSNSGPRYHFKNPGPVPGFPLLRRGRVVERRRHHGCERNCAHLSSNHAGDLLSASPSRLDLVRLTRSGLSNAAIWAYRTQ